MLITGARSTLRIKAGDHLFQPLLSEQDGAIPLAGVDLKRIICVGEHIDDTPPVSAALRYAETPRIYTIKDHQLPPGAPSSADARSWCKALVSERDVDVLVETSKGNLAISIIIEARPDEGPHCCTKPSFRVIKMPFRDCSYNLLPEITLKQHYLHHLAHLSVAEHGSELNNEVDNLLDDLYRIERWFDSCHRATFTLESMIEKALGASHFRAPPVEVFYMMLSGAYYSWEREELECVREVDEMLLRARKLVPKLARCVRELEEEVSVPADCERALEILYTICTSVYKHGTGTEFVRLMGTRAYASHAGRFKSVKKVEALVGFDENGIASSGKWACWVAYAVIATRLSQRSIDVGAR